MKKFNYIQNILNNGNHLRVDYKELIQLSFLYLERLVWKRHQFQNLRGSAWSKVDTNCNRCTYKLHSVPTVILSSTRTERVETGCMFCQPHICSRDFWHETIVSPKSPKKDSDPLKLLSTSPGADVKSSFSQLLRYIFDIR